MRRPNLHSPRLLRAGTILAGILAVANTVLCAFNGDWSTAVWSLVAAVWITIAAVHHCPTPVAPETAVRGHQAVNFQGGPEDGGQFYIPRYKDVLGAELTLSGAEYRVTGVEHTCFRADFVQLAPAESGADQ